MNAIGQMNAQSAPEPQRPIPQAIDSLQGSLSRLEHTAGILADKMARVLRPEPAPAPAPGQAHGGLTSVRSNSQLYDQVEMATLVAERVNNGLADLIERLEA